MKEDTISTMVTYTAQNGCAIQGVEDRTKGQRLWVEENKRPELS